MFPSEKECLRAEKEFKQKNEIKVNAEKDNSKLKKELADKITKAEDKIAEANSNYRLAKEEANKILEEANAKVKNLLAEASKKVRDAEKEKYEAVTEFTNKFGSYSVSYTGSKALEEFERAVSNFDRLFRNLFWF